MARTYREIAVEEMLRTVEHAMSQAINWWGDLPPPMKEAIEQFRTQLGVFQRHWLCTAAMFLMLISAPIKVVV
jgi:hypothetical protein